MENELQVKWQNKDTSTARLETIHIEFFLTYQLHFFLGWGFIVKQDQDATCYDIKEVFAFCLTKNLILDFLTNVWEFWKRWLCGFTMEYEPESEEAMTKLWQTKINNGNFLPQFMAQISGINSGLAYAPILVKSNQNGLDYQDFLEHHPFPGFTYRWSDGVIDTKRILI